MAKRNVRLQVRDLVRVVRRHGAPFVYGASVSGENSFYRATGGGGGVNVHRRRYVMGEPERFRDGTVWGL